jgi:hypothetical protein
MCVSENVISPLKIVSVRREHNDLTNYHIMVLSDQCNFYRHFGGAKQTKNHRPGTVAFMVLMSLKPSGLITWRLIGVVDLAAPMQIVAKSWIWPLDKLQKNMLPSGYDQHSHGKSPFVIGKPSINGPFSMAMLNNQRVDQQDVIQSCLVGG